MTSILWFLLNWPLNQAFFYLLLEHPAAEGICQSTENDGITPSKSRSQPHPANLGLLENFGNTLDKEKQIFH